MNRWNQHNRRIPRPELEVIDPGRVWTLRIDYMNGAKGSSARDEKSSTDSFGFGQCVYVDYMMLAVRKALAYIKANGWYLGTNLTTVADVTMLVYRPNVFGEAPIRALKDIVPAPHYSDNIIDPCFYCGKPRKAWGKPNENCPAFLEAMGYPVERPLFEGPDAVPERYVTLQNKWRGVTANSKSGKRRRLHKLRHFARRFQADEMATAQGNARRVELIASLNTGS
ncbi:MAG: hypothetical protein K2W82_16735 [Candidatus Obscuribacterales bacterium]|nr:hypothetical protein [Candidatus Obscuribacterales bacterium]